MQDWADGQAERVEEEEQEVEGQLLILREVEDESRKADGLFLLKLLLECPAMTSRCPLQLKFVRQSLL